MRRGDIALAILPQADGIEKVRPVLLLGRLPGYGDWLVVGISSQVEKAIASWDVELDPFLPEHHATGLKSRSIVRLGFVATLPSSRIRGLIGAMPTTTLDLVLRRLSDFLLAGKGSEQ